MVDPVGKTYFQGTTLAKTLPGQYGAVQLSEVINHWGEHGPTGDFTGDGHVSTPDLLYILARWGQNIPTGVLVQCGPIEVFGPNTLIENKEIHADLPVFSGTYWIKGQAISCAANTGNLTVRNCLIHSYRYGIWATGTTIILDHVTMDCAPAGLGDGDDYNLRGDMSHLHTNDCHFKSVGKAVMRVYFCSDHVSLRDTYEGPRLDLGGGASVEWNNAGPYKGDFTDCKIKCGSVEIYDKSDLVFTRCDFAGTGHISVSGNGKCVFNQCRNIPPINGPATVNP